MNGVRAGRLRHRITIEVGYTTTQDEFGQQVRTSAATVSRWAAVTPLSGAEMVDARQVQAEVTHLVEVRDAGDAKPTGAIAWRARRFEILSVLDVEEAGQLVRIFCKERV